MANLFIFVQNEEQYLKVLDYHVKYVCTNNYTLAKKYHDIYYEISSDELLDTIPNNLLALDTGIIFKYQKDHNIITNFNLNVANNETIKLLLENNVKYVLISLECNIDDIKLLNNKNNLLVWLYGTPKVMTLKQHPILKNNDILKNTNQEYKIKKEKGKICVYNYELLDKRKYLKDYLNIGIINYFISFLDESPDEIINVLENVSLNSH